jgi:lysophospholipase
VTEPEKYECMFVRHRGIDLRVCVLDCLKKPARGTVILVPGRTEFIEKYLEIISDMRARGFAVLIYDHRGQGLSGRLLADRLKSWVNRFSDYSKDLAFLMTALKDRLPRPHVLVGHSMGGAIALQALLRAMVKPDAAVMNAPMLGLVGTEQPGVPFMLSFLSMIGFSRRPIPMQPQSRGVAVDFSVNKLTTDRRRYDIWRSYFDAHEDLRVAGPTYGWITTSLRAMKEIQDKASKLQTPTLIVQPMADPIVVPEDVASFAEKSGAQFIPVMGALHETLMEKDVYRSQFFAAFDEFLDGQRI